ncbi:hypothetical protein BDZ89DRAFT_251980 [Hymenopellis radicata]|nr:hypothetical protein BDZ89DRAFT_251980 [Hymenopellis radicata]
MTNARFKGTSFSILQPYLKSRSSSTIGAPPPPIMSPDSHVRAPQAQGIRSILPSWSNTTVNSEILQRGR